MASTACDVPNKIPAQDNFATVAPKAASVRAGDGYVAIAPKSVAVTSESQSLSIKSNLSSPKLPPYKTKSYMTHSSRARAASDSIESHVKHRKSSKGSIKTALDGEIFTSGSLDSNNLGEMLLAPARWDGYVHIAPKGATRTFESQSLATPSSSMSPNSPAQYPKPYVIRTCPTHSSSTCAESHASPQLTSRILSKPIVDQRQVKSRVMITDNLGAITPALLARFYLPGILLQHGPLAIRHIMSFLTSAVPGFSRISPAKSRRLVVSALERRVSEGIVEDCECNVIFEKVGWGRWNARLSGHSRSPNRITYPGSPSSCKSDSQVVKKNDWNFEDIRSKKSGTSLHDDSVSYSHGDDMDVDMDIKIARIETDRISLDTHELYYSSSESLNDDELMSYDSSDTTDDEDWAALGAAALRAASYSTSSNSTNYLSPLAFTKGYRGDGEPALSTLMKSSPKQLSTLPTNIYTCNMTPNSQERDAVEALLHLGSV